MTFAVAAKGSKTAKSFDDCDAVIIYEKKGEKAFMLRAAENTRSKPLAEFLKELGVECAICRRMSEEEKASLRSVGIEAVTGFDGEAEEAAGRFAAGPVKKEANKKSCLNPMPRVLVSCRGANGEENALAVGYCGNCSYDPPMLMVGIVPSRYSYQMIKESGCFVVNIADEEYKDTFDYLGSRSKRDEDKLTAMNVRLADGKVVNAPILSDCPVNIECSVVDSIVTGSHEMFVGKVEYVHADASIVGCDGNIDFSSVSFIK